MKEVLVIVPTRGRPQRIQDFYNFFKMNSEISDLCLGIDEDEKDIYPNYFEAIYDINPNMKLCPKLNAISKKYVDQYKYICFMGDDVKVATKGWDVMLTEPLKDKIGISYGNDLLQGANLPNTIMVNSEFIKTLGFMAPPFIDHFYIDNFYRDTGYVLKILHYFADVILEHMHPAAGKAEIDDTYRSTNGLPGINIEGLQLDGFKYDMYQKAFWSRDLQKIEELIKSKQT